MNELQVFNYDQNEVRMIMQENGPWWVLKDVCEILDLKQSHRVAARLDDDEKGRTFLTTPGGDQEMTIINEAGLYSVILRSSKPEAKAFKRWITHEVLPAIRKTGVYAPQNAAIQAMERVSHCLEVMAERFSAMDERISALERRSDRPSWPGLAPAKDEDVISVPGKAARRRWMRTLNEKLDRLEERFGVARNELLHTVYLWLENDFEVILDEERIKTMEQFGLNDCSALMAIYYNDAFRARMQKHLDANLSPEDRGW